MRGMGELEQGQATIAIVTVGSGMLKGFVYSPFSMREASMVQ